MCVNYQGIQLEFFKQILKAVVEQTHIVTLAQYARDFARFNAGRNKKNLPFNIHAKTRGHIVSSFLDTTLTPQIVIKRRGHFFLIHLEQDVNAW